MPIPHQPLSRARITRNISRRGCPCSRPTRRRFSPPHRKRRKPPRFSSHFRPHERPLPSRVSQFSPMPCRSAAHRSFTRAPLHARAQKPSLAPLLPPCFSDRLSETTAAAVPVFVMSFAKNRRQASNPSTLPGSTDAAFAVKTERLPRYWLPPLRQGAEALLTAHSARIGDRTGQRGCQPGDLKTRKDIR